MPKVLVADDSIAVRKVAERLLTEAGFGVTLAANGEEALAYLAKETPDLVVSDVIMPDKSGYQVCASIRAQRALADMPVLLISGIVNDEVTKQAESCHADGVLKKPFQGTSLKDRVLELLAKRKSRATVPVKKVEKVIEPMEPIQSSSANGDQAEVFRQTVRRVKSLEEELRIERDRVMEFKTQLDRVKDLESLLAGEREQTAQLKMRLAAADSAIAQAQELESLLKVERERALDAKMQASVAESLGVRVRELEAVLGKEREDRAQCETQLAELQRTKNRVQELESTLHAERQAAQQLVEQMTELEQALAAEREKTKVLAVRARESESASQKLHELETSLQMAQERNNLLAKRVAETEQEAEQATKRFDEMARKLGEIAGLASQLGSGKRRP